MIPIARISEKIEHVTATLPCIFISESFGRCPVWPMAGLRISLCSQCQWRHLLFHTGETLRQGVYRQILPPLPQYYPAKGELYMYFSIFHEICIWLYCTFVLENCIASKINSAKLMSNRFSALKFLQAKYQMVCFWLKLNNCTWNGRDLYRIQSVYLSCSTVCPFHRITKESMNLHSM